MFLKKQRTKSSDVQKHLMLRFKCLLKKKKQRLKNKQLKKKYKTYQKSKTDCCSH